MVNSNGADHVRASTAESVNRELDREMAGRVREVSSRGPQAIRQRIAELDREWDIERLLEMNASALAMTGVALGALHDRRWLLLPAVVLPFLFQHAIQGWCPPVPVFRRLGVRTRQEIDRERYALMAARGDFAGVTQADPADRGPAAVKAVGV
jgi:hypothetical protein